MIEDGEARVVELGRVSGLFGVRGWVKIYSYTRPPEEIFRYGRWQLKAPAAAEWEVEVVEGRTQSRGLVAQLRRVDGAVIEDREDAAALVGASIAVKRSALEAPPPGSYYWADLIGLRVQSLSGAPLGQVKSLVENGAQDVLVLEDGEVERLIPFVREAIVQSVDLEAGVIVVAWEPDY